MATVHIVAPLQFLNWLPTGDAERDQDCCCFLLRGQGDPSGHMVGQSAPSLPRSPAALPFIRRISGSTHGGAVFDGGSASASPPFAILNCALLRGGCRLETVRIGAETHGNVGFDTYLARFCLGKCGYSHKCHLN